MILLNLQVSLRRKTKNACREDFVVETHLLQITHASGGETVLRFVERNYAPGRRIATHHDPNGDEINQHHGQPDSGDERRLVVGKKPCTLLGCARPLDQTRWPRDNKREALAGSKIFSTKNGIARLVARSRKGFALFVLVSGVAVE